MTRARAAVVWVAGVAIGGGFLWLSLRGIDIGAVLSHVSGADRFQVAAVILCALGFALLKSWRWARLIDHLRPVPWRKLVGPVFVGTAVNYGVPHAGELVRAWMVASRERIANSALLASIGVERLLDFCAVLLLGLVAMLEGRSALDMLGPYLGGLTALIAALLAVVLPFVLWPGTAIRAARVLFRSLPRQAGDWLTRHLTHGIEGLKSLQGGGRLTRLLALSVAQWMFMAGCAWFSVRSIGAAAEPSQAIVILLLLVVGLTLPAAPGHVGTTQVAFLLAATPFGLGEEKAIAGSFIYNFFVPLTFILPAIVLTLRRRLPDAMNTPEDTGTTR